MGDEVKSIADLERRYDAIAKKRLEELIGKRAEEITPLDFYIYYAKQASIPLYLTDQFRFWKGIYKKRRKTNFQKNIMIQIISVHLYAIA